MGFDALMAERRAPLPPLQLLGREVRGVVSWNMNDTCNYRCSYCTQRFMPERTYRLEDITAYLDAFARLPGCWEVKLSGGEPFQQPGLTEIVAGLVERGHLVSVQTNLSASQRKLDAFLEATRARIVFGMRQSCPSPTSRSFCISSGSSFRFRPIPAWPSCLIGRRSSSACRQLLVMSASR